MFKKKCVKEVESFNNLKVDKSFSANKLIGVQEINHFSEWFNINSTM